jgi:putative transposase
MNPRVRYASGDVRPNQLRHAQARRAAVLLFDKAADYLAFEKILQEVHDRTGIRIAAYCLMPNHWHLLLWPRTDGELSEVMRWITVTHTQRWHAHRHSSGTGPVYQGRFKSFPVQTDEHFITVARYVERNALRAKLAVRCEERCWSSLFKLHQRETSFLSEWPMERPQNWIDYVNAAHSVSELEDLRCSAQRGGRSVAKIG